MISRSLCAGIKTVVRGCGLLESVGLVDVRPGRNDRKHCSENVRTGTITTTAKPVKTIEITVASSWCYVSWWSPKGYCTWNLQNVMRLMEKQRNYMLQQLSVFLTFYRLELPIVESRNCVNFAVGNVKLFVTKTND